MGKKVRFAFYLREQRAVLSGQSSHDLYISDQLGNLQMWCFGTANEKAYH